MFDQPEREKHRSLDQVADRIAVKFGTLAIRRGARLHNGHESRRTERFDFGSHNCCCRDKCP